MSDKLIRATAKGGDIRILGAITTDLVNYGVSIHKCAPTAAAAFGRMLTAGSLMGAMLKSAQDKLTIQINGGGTSGGILITAQSDASVKGYIVNPNADLPANSKGKLDVGGIVGKNGSLIVIKDMGLKQPYTGQVPIYSGEIAEDIAYYFTVSEQTPSAVGLGVLVDTDLSVKAAGGFIIQMMPQSDALLADLITYRLEEIPQVTDLISSGKTIEEILEYIFEGMELNILGSMVPEFKCDCSRAKVERALISIGKKELETIYSEGKTEELKCHFCQKTYEFSHNQIGEIIQSLNR
jgi:molecular chaperone Hsp33